MIVTRDEFSSVIDTIQCYDSCSLDTETSGLYPYKKDGDRLFCITVSTKNKDYYFNFSNELDHLGTRINPLYILQREWVLHFHQCLSDKLIFLHNAKYDAAMLALESFGILITKIAKKIHCTQAIGRVEKNDRLNYKLETLASEIGAKKGDLVKKYCDDNKLYTMVARKGKKSKDKCYHYGKVPLMLMIDYACMDSRITYDLGIHQINTINKVSASMPEGKPKLNQVMEMEQKLTPVLFDMEYTGIKIDVPFVQDAMRFELKRRDSIEKEFIDKCWGEVTSISKRKDLIKAFDLHGEHYPKTDKGNPSFNKEALEGMKTPIAKLVQEFRDAERKASMYYGSMLEFIDANGIIHANIRQGGAGTGRMSYSGPNLQNQKKVEDGDEDYTNKYLVRRSFIPRKGCNFFMLDFDQMEYKMMLDYANETKIIKQVMAGVDVHQATANIMSVSRKIAKTINFMLLYGGGVAKLCLALHNPTLPEALLKDLEKLYRWKDLNPETIAIKMELEQSVIELNIIELNKAFKQREHYFKNLPRVKNFIKNVRKTAKDRGFIFNWYGRRYNFRKHMAYKAPNYLIQGGCADVVKLAMVELADFLLGFETKMLIQIHDEILFEVPHGEEHILSNLKAIMEGIYPHKRLPMTCGIEYSYLSWQDKKPYTP